MVVQRKPIPLVIAFDVHVDEWNGEAPLWCGDECGRGLHWRDSQSPAELFYGLARLVTLAGHVFMRSALVKSSCIINFPTKQLLTQVELCR